jgi:hypothetical protein
MHYLPFAALLLGAIQALGAATFLLFSNWLTIPTWNEWLFYSGIAWMLAGYVLVEMDAPKTEKLVFSSEFCLMNGAFLAWTELRVRVHLQNALGLQVDKPELAERAEIWLKSSPQQECRVELQDVSSQLDAIKKLLLCAPAGCLAKFSNQDHAEFQQKMQNAITSLGAIYLGVKAHSNKRALAVLGGSLGGTGLGSLLYWLGIASWITETETESGIAFSICAMAGAISAMAWIDFYFYTDRIQLSSQGIRSQFYGEATWTSVENVQLQKYTKYREVIITLSDTGGTSRELRWQSALNESKAEQLAKLCQSHVLWHHQLSAGQTS